MREETKSPWSHRRIRWLDFLRNCLVSVLVGDYFLKKQINLTYYLFKLLLWLIVIEINTEKDKGEW